MSLSSSEKSYSVRLKTHLLSLIRPGMSFAELMREAKGAYPLEVIELLHEMENESNSNIVTEILNTQKLNGQHTIHNGESNLAHPHPGDYDWRFSSTTIKALSEKIISSVDKTDNVSLFGTTTLFPVLKKTLPDVVLFNKSELLIAELKSVGFESGLVVHDLFFPFKERTEKSQLVVADPPWYNDFYEAFMLRAAELLPVGGMMLLSVLPELTRPSAVDDRTHIMEFAKRCGFLLSEKETNYLEYESPPFEQKALEVKGIQITAWRLADLFIFKKISELDPSILVTPPIDEPTWKEYQINKIKVKVRDRSVDHHSLLEIKLVDLTPTYGTVSRRSPLRHMIDFWTSQNVAYSISRIDIVDRALILLVNLRVVTDVMTKIDKEYGLKENERAILGSLLQSLNTEEE